MNKGRLFPGLHRPAFSLAALFLLMVVAAVLVALIGSAMPKLDKADVDWKLLLIVAGAGGTLGGIVGSVVGAAQPSKLAGLAIGQVTGVILGSVCGATLVMPVMFGLYIWGVFILVAVALFMRSKEARPRAAGASHEHPLLPPTTRSAIHPQQAADGDPRTAFTLVEMLVCIAIMGILMAVLLPALQEVRESSRRAKCQHQLGRLILAVGAYEQAHAAFPMGTSDSAVPIQSTAGGGHHNWLGRCLPFADEGVVHSAINFQAGVYAPENAPVRAISRGLWICPSDPGPRILGGAGQTSYAGCHNDFEAPIAPDNRGVFIQNRAVTVAEVLDGLSSTVFLGEKARRAGRFRLPDAGDSLGWMSGTRASLRNMGTPINSAAAHLADGTQVLPPGMTLEIEVGSADFDAIAGVRSSPDSSTTLPADPPPATGNSQGTAPTLDGAPYVSPREVRLWQPKSRQPVAAVAGPYVGGFGSFHCQGANFALGDGSVRFLTESIDFNVYLNLGHRSDGAVPATF
jgi:prepilin-type N-terminal cleavage/methylation domain-containing protein